MPLLEVLYTNEQPLPADRKRAFLHDMVELFRDVLGTPPGRLRVVLQHAAVEDTTDALKE